MFGHTLLPRQRLQHRYSGPDFLQRFFETEFPQSLFQREADNLSGQEQKHLLPTMDVTSTDQAYTIHAEVPGVAFEDMTLEVKNGLLVLTAEKKETKQDDEHHVSERSYGTFMRELTLPEDCDTDAISATHKDGVLTITIPRKTTKAAAQTIAITRS